MNHFDAENGSLAHGSSFVDISSISLEELMDDLECQESLKLKAQLITCTRRAESAERHATSAAEQAVAAESEAVMLANLLERSHLESSGLRARMETLKEKSDAAEQGLRLKSARTYDIHQFDIKPHDQGSGCGIMHMNGSACPPLIEHRLASVVLTRRLVASVKHLTKKLKEERSAHARACRIARRAVHKKLHSNVNLEVVDSSETKLGTPQGAKSNPDLDDKAVFSTPSTTAAVSNTQAEDTGLSLQDSATSFQMRRSASMPNDSFIKAAKVALEHRFQSTSNDDDDGIEDGFSYFHTFLPSQRGQLIITNGLYSSESVGGDPLKGSNKCNPVKKNASHYDEASTTEAAEQADTLSPYSLELNVRKKVDMGYGSVHLQLNREQATDGISEVCHQGSHKTGLVLQQVLPPCHHATVMPCQPLAAVPSRDVRWSWDGHSATNSGQRTSRVGRLIPKRHQQLVEEEEEQLPVVALQPSQQQLVEEEEEQLPVVALQPLQQQLVEEEEEQLPVVALQPLQLNVGGTAPAGVQVFDGLLYRIGGQNKHDTAAVPSFGALREVQLEQQGELLYHAEEEDSVMSEKEDDAYCAQEDQGIYSCSMAALIKEPEGALGSIEMMTHAGSTHDGTAPGTDDGGIRSRQVIAAHSADSEAIDYMPPQVITPSSATITAPLPLTAGSPCILEVGPGTIISTTISPVPALLPLLLHEGDEIITKHISAAGSQLDQAVAAATRQKDQKQAAFASPPLLKRTHHGGSCPQEMLKATDSAINNHVEVTAINNHVEVTAINNHVEVTAINNHVEVTAADDHHHQQTSSTVLKSRVMSWLKAAKKSPAADGAPSRGRGSSNGTAAPPAADGVPSSSAGRGTAAVPPAAETHDDAGRKAPSMGSTNVAQLAHEEQMLKKSRRSAGTAAAAAGSRAALLAAARSAKTSYVAPSSSAPQQHNISNKATVNKNTAVAGLAVLRAPPISFVGGLFNKGYGALSKGMTRVTAATGGVLYKKTAAAGKTDAAVAATGGVLYKTAAAGTKQLVEAAAVCQNKADGGKVPSTQQQQRTAPMTSADRQRERLKAFEQQRLAHTEAHQRPRSKLQNPNQHHAKA
ncbi:hypothetical protein CEUSTIGMA_g4576.t1 [Chlamydomonas eustigma]|uniref:Uncharacterized protein n=1 Tax=Chlamydomonas eustigma TaxID=1157962 RepID=A0A250X2Y9_9CHLO|nr:hypothetical protein CEUSTIGMA_g4576.t1 [Chlamydomonas eustigma]|eukprot:GAX77130.1 hypothetical protein CEUSTIGMA_g4576.t1 [Chlamydomonas eustigma]